MELTPQLRHRLQLGGIVLGLVLGAVMSWTTSLAWLFALRGVPIDAASFGLRPDVVALVTVSNMLGAALAGYVIARLWERPVTGVILGALITALVSIFTGYAQMSSALEGNAFAEFILLQLPIALIFGGWVWFLGGLVGAAAIRLALGGAARLFAGGRPVLTWGLLVGVGIALGLLAGGARQERRQAVLAARAVDAAIRQSAGDDLSAADLPPLYLVSKKAQDSLRGLGEDLQSPYTLALVQDIIQSHETTIELRFQGGPVLSCVSTGARISRCFESGGP